MKTIKFVGLFLIILGCNNKNTELKEQESKPIGKGLRLYLRKAKRVCRLSLGYLLCKLFEIAGKYIKH